MLHILENDVLRVAIDDHGAQLMSILGKKDNTEYLWQGDARYWKDRAIMLFPICVLVATLGALEYGEAVGRARGLYYCGLIAVDVRLLGEPSDHFLEIIEDSGILACLTDVIE